MMSQTAPLPKPSRTLPLLLVVAALLALGALRAVHGQDRAELPSWVFLR